jgi:hypothetical protein
MQPTHTNRYITPTNQRGPTDFDDTDYARRYVEPYAKNYLEPSGGPTGGGTPPVNKLVDEPFTTGIGDFTFTRAGEQWVTDFDGVRIKLDPNEFGLAGSRRVKNLFLNSNNMAFFSAPVWNLLEGSVSGQTIIANDGPGGDSAATTTTPPNTGGGAGPYFYAAEGESTDEGLYAWRAEYKSVSGSGRFTIQTRTASQDIGSESAGWTFTPTTDWLTYSQTLESFEKHNGARGVAIFPSGDAGNPEAVNSVSRVQLEDVSGHKTEQWNSEYVIADSSYGIQWFDTDRSGISRTNPSTPYGVDPLTTTYGGTQTISAGAPLTGMRGYQSEPASNNRVLANGSLSNIGTAVLDCISSNYPGEVAALAGRNSILLDPRSMRNIFRVDDIEVTANSLISSTTDFIAAGHRDGHTVWLYRADTGIQGPVIIDTVTANLMTFTTSVLTPAAAGTDTDVMRVPGSGVDNEITFRLNDGTYHETTVTSVVLPTVYGDHESVLVNIAVAPPTDGGWANTNNNQPVYFYNKLTSLPTVTGGVQLRAVARREEIVQLGLGEICKNGMMFEAETFTTTSSGTVVFPENLPRDYSTYSGTIWARCDNTINCTFAVDGVPGSVTPIPDTGWERIGFTTELFNDSNKLILNIGSYRRVWFMLPQLERHPSVIAGGYGPSSEIVGNDQIEAQRFATRLSKTWGLANVNDMECSMTMCCSWPNSVGPEQVLWSIYNSASNYVQLNMEGNVFTLRKVTGGTLQEVTVNYTVTDDTPVDLEWSFSSTEGMTITVAGNTATNASSTGDLPITPASLHEIGSMNGNNVAYAAFKDLVITGVPAAMVWDNQITVGLDDVTYGYQSTGNVIGDFQPNVVGDTTCTRLITLGTNTSQLNLDLAAALNGIDGPVTVDFEGDSNGPYTFNQIVPGLGLYNITNAPDMGQYIIDNNGQTFGVNINNA